MTNGKPQTDRELLLQIDQKVTHVQNSQKILFKKVETAHDMIQTQQIQCTALTGRVDGHEQKFNTIDDNFKKQPSIWKVVGVVGIIIGGFVSLATYLGSL